MHPINGLPKTAEIKCIGTGYLEIKDHKVVNWRGGIMEWLTNVLLFYGHSGQYDNAVTQMIQQGFKFEGVKEQCILDLQNEKKLEEILWQYVQDKGTQQKIQKLVKSETGKNIARDIIEMIKTCDNWDQFFVEMRKESAVQKKIRARIIRGIKQI